MRPGVTLSPPPASTLPASMAREPLLTRSFVVVSAAHFLYSLALHVYLHLPGYLGQLGATEVEIGALFGVSAAVAIASRPVLGRTIDLRGRRAVILAGGALDTAVCFLYLTVHALGPWLVVVRLLHGLSQAMLFASLFAFASDIVPASRRIEGIALFGISGMLPLALGGLLGDFILRHGAYEDLFLASGLLAGVALLLSLPLRDTPRRADRAPPRGITHAFAQRDLLPLWFIGLVFAMGLSATATFVKTFVLATGVGSVGLFFTAYALAAIVLRLFFGSIPERVGPKRALFPAMAALALGLAWMARAGASTDVAVAGVLCGLGHGYTFPILVGFVVARARPSEHGAVLAIFTAVFDAGMLVGAPLLGLTIRLAGYPAMFGVASAVVVLGAVTFGAWDHARAPIASS